MKEYDIKLILGVGTPWSDFLVASQLSKAKGIPWVANYRDPWTQKTHLKNSIKWFLRDIVNRAIERNVCNTADKIIHASEVWADQIQELFPQKEVSVLPNGYDADLFEKVKHVDTDKEKFTLAYIGHIHFIQKLDIFFQGFEDFIQQNNIPIQDCRLNFVGEQNIKTRFQKFELIRSYMDVAEQVPVEKAYEYMRKAHVLLLFNSELRGWYPTKLFEYLACGRPILATPDDKGVIRDLLRKTKSGVSLNTPEEVSEWLKIQYGNFQTGLNVNPERQNQAIEKYNREILAQKLDEILSSVICSQGSDDANKK